MHKHKLFFNKMIEITLTKKMIQSNIIQKWQFKAI